MIQVPLSEVSATIITKSRNRNNVKFLVQNEMAVRYSINNGQTLEFFVPGRHQNMRWTAYSVIFSS